MIWSMYRTVSPPNARCARTFITGRVELSFFRGGGTSAIESANRSDRTDRDRIESHGSDRSISIGIDRYRSMNRIDLDLDDPDRPDRDRSVGRWAIVVEPAPRPAVVIPAHDNNVCSPRFLLRRPRRRLQGDQGPSTSIVLCVVFSSRDRRRSRRWRARLDASGRDGRARYDRRERRPMGDER